MTDLERAAQVVAELRNKKLISKDYSEGWLLAINEVEAAILALPQGSVEPVGYVMQAKDGSIGKEIAPVGWSTFDKELAKIKAHPWVVNGAAKVIPLYAHQPADEGISNANLIAAAGKENSNG
jgi:hypothetical protein